LPSNPSKLTSTFSQRVSLEVKTLLLRFIALSITTHSIPKHTQKQKQKKNLNPSKINSNQFPSAEAPK
jgi:hypothetical protein